jgi:hypothetical protein
VRESLKHEETDMDQPTRTPTPFTDLLRLWRQGWLRHAEMLRAAEAAHAATRTERRETVDAPCGCVPACC